MVEAAQAILMLATGRSGWRIEGTDGGAASDSYLASRDDERLVLKFAALPPGLERLAELGVTPRVTGTGEYQGQPWVLQEFVPGYHPSSSWFVEHLPELAALQHRYHDDLPLRWVLEHQPAPVHGRGLAQAAAELGCARQILGSISSDVADLPYAFDCYEGQLRALDFGPEVPVHSDPNRSNMIVAKEALFLVDWDEICLSDPLADAGPMLWWYVPAAHWPEFFAAYGLDSKQAGFDRVFWWAARRSLQVVMWLAERGRQEATGDFLVDFVAAACQRPNPRWHPYFANGDTF